MASDKRDRGSNYLAHRFVILSVYFFFFNDTATTEIYTLSLHDALPISPRPATCASARRTRCSGCPQRDRKSTRLNSSHITISYAVFCLKKKKQLTQVFNHIQNKKIDLLYIPPFKQN